MSRRYCSFWVGDHLFGVPVEGVQEVLVEQQVTPVPLAPPHLVGLLNVRGQVVTVLDIRRRLSLAGQPYAPGQVHVVVLTADGAVSLLADRIGEVLTPDDGSLETPPDTMDPSVRRLVSAICKLDEHLLLVLDIDTTIAVGGAA